MVAEKSGSSCESWCAFTRARKSDQSLSTFVAGGLLDRVKLEGDGFGVGFREFQSLENLVIHQHEIDRREGKFGRGFKLMEIRGLGEDPITQIR